MTAADVSRQNDVSPFSVLCRSPAQRHLSRIMCEQAENVEWEFMWFSQFCCEAMACSPTAEGNSKGLKVLGNILKNLEATENTSVASIPRSVWKECYVHTALYRAASGTETLLFSGKNDYEVLPWMMGPLELRNSNFNFSLTEVHIFDF